MLSEWTQALSQFAKNAETVLLPWLICLACLSAINIINWVILGSSLNRLGLYPRRISGLPGIIFCPILHGNFNHLFFNMIPLFVLGLALLAQGYFVFYWVTLIVVLLGGLGVWIFGRSSRHIGASGLISGYFGFILVQAYFNPSILTVLLALMVLYYFGSIFLGIFPQEDKISWESHLFGFLSGMISAYWLELYTKHTLTFSNAFFLNKF